MADPLTSHSLPNYKSQKQKNRTKKFATLKTAQAKTQLEKKTDISAKYMTKMIFIDT
jgi:hypothetical protein